MNTTDMMEETANDEKNMEKLLKSAEVRLVLDALVEEHDKMQRLRLGMARTFLFYPVALSGLVVAYLLGAIDIPSVVAGIIFLSVSIITDTILLYREMGRLLKGTTASQVAQHRKTLTDNY